MGNDRRARRLFRLFAGPGRARREVDEEVRFHLERKVERLVTDGLSREEAQAEALRRFGDVERFAEEAAMAAQRRERDSVWGEAADALRQDVGYAVRQLVRAPGFTLVTVLTLTLGIGATTALFSVVDGILFRPLPFQEPEELVAVWSDYTRQGGPANEWPNFPNLWELREQSETLETLGIRGGSSVTLTGLDGPPEFLNGASVSHQMLAEVLRVDPFLGRGIAPEDDRPGAPPTVLLSHGLWVRAFGADPEVVGRSIVLNGVPTLVIGVMPASFRPPPILNGEFWMPLRMDISDHGCGRGGACLHAIARLADGVDLEAARAEAAGIAARQEAEYPQANAGVDWNLQPLQDDLVAVSRTPLLLLLGAAGFVLLIACVNQAGLLLARGTDRQGELAVRSALGAGRRRIVSQLMVENVLLALVGGALGIGAAFVLTDLLVGLAPPGTPRLDEVVVDGRVLGFAAAVTVLAALLFGIVPALRSAGTALHAALREGGRGDPRSGGIRLRQALVASQVALAFTLVTASGLLVRTLQNLREVDLGFRPEGVLSFRIGLPASRYPSGEPLVSFHRELEERLGALPGVAAAEATSSLPLSGFNSDMGFTVEGRPVPRPDEPQVVWYRSVTPGFLEAIGTPLMRGRGIEARDDERAPRVVVVNETFARRLFPNEDPIGQRINFRNPAEPEWWEIVGVARDVRHFGVRGEARLELYLPVAQFPARTMFWAVRSAGDPAGLVGGVRAALAAVDPEVAPGQMAPLTTLIQDDLAPDRFVASLLALFASLAMALATVGLYGTVSYNVGTRLREMGVRLALGASAGEVGGLVVRRSLGVVAVGLVVGLIGTLGLTRFLEGLLFGIRPADPLTFAATSLLLLTVAAVAAGIPARRAARVDPVEVLRTE